MVYARTIGDSIYTFDFAEGLINDNLLLVDRETNSVWSQLANSAVHGKMKGTSMQVIPAIQTTWKTWRELHPDTRVMVVAGEEGYRYFYRNRKPGAPPPKERPDAHDTSALGLGVSMGGEARFYPLETLVGKDSPFNDRLGGQEISIHFGPDGLSAWAKDAGGALLPAVMAYRDGWIAFVPDTTIFGEPRQGGQGH